MRIQAARPQEIHRPLDAGECRVHHQQRAAVGQQSCRRRAQRDPAPCGRRDPHSTPTPGPPTEGSTPRHHRPMASGHKADWTRRGRTGRGPGHLSTILRAHRRGHRRRRRFRANTTRVQTSNAVTLAAPIAAAAIATTPLPGHRSSTRCCGQVGSLHRFDQQHRIMLRWIDTVDVQRSRRWGVCDRHAHLPKIRIRCGDHGLLLIHAQQARPRNRIRQRTVHNVDGSSLEPLERVAERRKVGR